MNRRAVIAIAIAMAALLSFTACGDDEQSAGGEHDLLRASVVSALDFPPVVFEGWEITDAVDRPTADRRTPASTSALLSAAGADPANPPSDGQVAPEECSATNGVGDAAWKAANGTGEWAGEVGAKQTAHQSFRVDVSQDPERTLDAVTRFVEQCGTYTFETGGKQIEVTTAVTESEVLRYGLADLRMFTTTAKTADPNSTYSTLTAVGTHNGRVVAAQFTTPGLIEGPVINVAGNFWTIVATKFVAQS